MDQHTRELYAEAVLGGDADDFFQTELGHYVLARSKEEVDEGLQQLKIVHAEKTEDVFRLQMKVLIAEKAIQWLNDVLISGKQALQMLEEGE